MMNMIPKKYQDLLDEFPFLTLIKYGGNEYVGIIQNMDNNLASMYNFENIKDTDDKREFLEIGEEWWWGTNRMIPINIIFKSKDNVIVQLNSYLSTHFILLLSIFSSNMGHGTNVFS